MKFKHPPHCGHSHQQPLMGTLWGRPATGLDLGGNGAPPPTSGWGSGPWRGEGKAALEPIGLPAALCGVQPGTPASFPLLLGTDMGCGRPDLCAQPVPCPSSGLGTGTHTVLVFSVSSAHARSRGRGRSAGPGCQCGGACRLGLWGQWRLGARSWRWSRLSEPGCGAGFSPCPPGLR